MTRISMCALSSAVVLLALSANGARADDTKKTPPTTPTTTKQTKPTIEITDYGFGVEQAAKQAPQKPQGGPTPGGGATTGSHKSKH